MNNISDPESSRLLAAFRDVLAFVNDGAVPEGAGPRDVEERALGERVRLALRVYLVERSPESVGEMDALASEFPVRLRFDVRDGYPACRLDPVPDGFGGYVAWVLAVLHEGLAAGFADRVKVCRNEECAWLFFDESRNRSRVWCDMARCGSRMKARAYRARRRSDRPRDDRARPRGHRR